MSSKTQTPASAEVVETTSELALPSDLMAELASEAKDAAAKERPSISKISLKSGVMSYGGTPLPGNKVEAIILVAGYRNTYYAGRYDANNVVNPSCFALSEEDEGMVPHENVIEPENEVCSSCPRSEWGSDPNGGRGKACKQSRRLVLIPATALAEGPEKIKSAELAILDLPVTSVKNYSQMVNTLSVSANVPAYAAVVQISVVPNAKTQFQVNFQAMRVVPSVELLNAIRARRGEALRIALSPYETTETKASLAEEKGPKSSKY